MPFAARVDGKYFNHASSDLENCIFKTEILHLNLDSRRSRNNMHTAAAICLLTGFAQLAQANWFKEFNDTDTNWYVCRTRHGRSLNLEPGPLVLHGRLTVELVGRSESTPFKEYTGSDLDSDDCFALDEGTVSVISHCK